MSDEVARFRTEGPVPCGSGVSFLDAFQLQLQHSGFTLQDLQKAGREEATELLKELGCSPVQRQRALKELGL